MNRELHDLLVAVRAALEHAVVDDPVPAAGTSAGRTATARCDRCGHCIATDAAFLNWEQWLRRMGWQGGIEYDIARRGWLVAVWREARVVGPLFVPDRGQITGHPTLVDAYRETLDRIERGAVVEVALGAILECETGWWRSESQEAPSCAPL